MESRSNLRGPGRHVKLGVVLEALEIAAGIVFAAVLLLFFFGPWRN
jgi:hypothetical protein